MDMINDAAQVAQHEVNRAVQAAQQSPAPAGGEFLTFRLGAEEYGIDILRVQEIRSYEQPTPRGSPTRRSSSRAWSTCAAPSCRSSTCA
jgi:hypothetical protein